MAGDLKEDIGDRLAPAAFIPQFNPWIKSRLKDILSSGETTFTVKKERPHSVRYCWLVTESPSRDSPH
jgi:hypothetical protein